MGIKTHKAFTIIELLVAMALVVILVALSSVIFAVAVRAHRMADSTLEISRRAEVIAEQLLSDVRGLRKDAPLAIWFERDATTGRHYDQILFFANGNFQTTISMKVKPCGAICRGFTTGMPGKRAIRQNLF